MAEGESQWGHICLPRGCCGTTWEEGSIILDNVLLWQRPGSQMCDGPWGEGASNLVFLSFIWHLLMASDTPWNLTEG